MIISIIKMCRPINIVIAIITLIIGYYLLYELELQKTFIYSLIIQSLGFTFAISFANIQNDVLDIKSDTLNRPDRILVKGDVSIKFAQIIWKIMFILTLLCGLINSIIIHFNFIPFTFFLFLALLLIAYNKKLKHIPLLKNMTVAFLCTTPLFLNLLNPFCCIESNDFICNYKNKILILFPAILFAFLLTLVREIYKDLEDELGDLKAGIMTFPLIVGTTKAKNAASLLLAFTWILLPLPVIQKTYSYSFLILTELALTPCIIIILFQAYKRKNFHLSQKITKVAMFLGLISLIICKNI